MKSLFLKPVQLLTLFKLFNTVFSPWIHFHAIQDQVTSLTCFNLSNLSCPLLYLLVLSRCSLCCYFHSHVLSNFLDFPCIVPFALKYFFPLLFAVTSNTSLRYSSNTISVCGNNQDSQVDLKYPVPHGLICAPILVLDLLSKYLLSYYCALGTVYYWHLGYTIKNTQYCS